MNPSNYDVVVVGAGAAGVTAAIALARAGLAVAVVEAAEYAGAENWSGCVYFAENLAHPEVLGPTGVEALAWERRLVERGFFATDGHGLLGMTYRDPAAFRHCYTVLRPVYDHHLAQVAAGHGVALLNETTAESLIRDGGRVVGVCTQRGPLYADLVFLAEGDASHLVTREGYERFTDPREAPKFLQGIKQVIDLPPGAIEQTFGVGPEEGVAYEFLLRNGTLRGRPLHLNAGGFLYTNRQSLSVGLVLPADNLHEHFEGDPNLLMEWVETLPALRPWLKNGRRGVFGAKIIRGGGARDIPNLIDDGLAVGGAASGVGIDFPYPNFTGPATAMGLLIARAARRIRAEGGRFTRDELRKHYLEPLQRTHYWRDVEFLRRWPGYVKRTTVFFGRDLDLALGSAYVWTRPDRWALTKWVNWVRLCRHVASPAHWAEMRQDVRHLVRALRLRDVADRPQIWRLLLDGSVNALRDLFGRPRANLPEAGTLRLHYAAAGGTEPAGGPPRALRRWFGRFQPVLAAAARRVYTNDSTPLEEKLPAVVRLLVRQVNIADLLGAGAVALAAGASATVVDLWDRLRGLVGGRRLGRAAPGLYRRYARAVAQATDLTPLVAPAGPHWEARLGRLAYHTVKESHVHVLWPQNLAEKDAVAAAGLWHVCPAHVYEARTSPLGQVQVIVNFENCIKCETCWRTSDLVDWGRDGRQRFTYPVHTPVVSRLLEAARTAGPVRPGRPRALDPWGPAAAAFAAGLRGASAPGNGQAPFPVAEVRRLLDRLDRKLQEFDDALGEEPRTVDRARAEYLEMLARYAQQLALRVQELLRERVGAEPAYRPLLELAGALADKAQERARRTWTQRYSWAAGDGRQLRWHHVAGMRRLLDAAGTVAGAAPGPDPLGPWLRAEADAAAAAGVTAAWTARLDAAFPPGAWRGLEEQEPLTPEQDAVLRDLLAQVPAVDPANLRGTLHPPVRKALLAELGRRDPSLAYRAVSHLWARDLAGLAAGSSAWARAVGGLARGDEWACFAAIDAARDNASGWRGEVLFVPAEGARALVLLVRDQLVLVRPGDRPAGLAVESLGSLGLRGAGLARVRLDGFVLPESRVGVDYDRITRVWAVLSSADLTSVAAGMADLLCRRAIGHATSRVQFPGLFHDEQARDAIGKFGAVKKMVADMAARRYLIETLDHVLTPGDFSAAALERATVVKALAAEALGTAPGSVAYNAGQVFGGTGYSEDDVLSKYYRDAAAWRFLGVPNGEVYRRHGRDLLRGWRADGHALAEFPGEVDHFEDVAQRKALQADLDEIRNARSRLRALVGEWQAARDRADRPETAAEFAEALARQDAGLLASKALVLRTHARLEEGLPAEVETALVRVWLGDAAAALDHFEADVHRWLDPAGRRDERPVVEPSAGPPAAVYADFLAAPAKYDSGDYLVMPADLAQPRFVPEMVQTDPGLAGHEAAVRALLAGHFGPPRDGLGYERYVEVRHRPDPADLDFCREHGFFRMPIPPELGGAGRSKVEYYLLTTNAQRLADIAVALTIQVNTSLGTTPVLLARGKDLPRARKDLDTFVGDQALRDEVRRGLHGLPDLAERGDDRRLADALTALKRRLDEAVLGRAVLRALFHSFAARWQAALDAARDADVTGARARLEEARAAWQEAEGRSAELQGELAGRLEACDLYLRWVAAGQIAAFALTEPSAGSDTARVATRARPRSVVADPGPDGTYRFTPAGGKEPRTLLDARRLEFPGGVPHYRWSDTATAPIRFDDYDYETDDPRRTRYFEAHGRRVPFHDVAQLRERDGRTWYDYWELTGAKMWITSGRMCGVLCLYAKADEGVTAFMVDRHAEGLVVGKDEAKMGQCGSPTNELSLQGVRVARENVLGVEGRGQVNALEALAVGRAGMAMTAMAPMQGLIEMCRALTRQHPGEAPEWVRWRLRRMEEDCFTAEALAFETVGRFEHPQTRSARVEGAVAKMLTTELQHRMIETAEEVHGLAGQTRLHLVEKRKRDARVLNIYEGTNEVQRFLILKDLAAEVAPRWARTPPAPPAHAGREALELEAVKAGLRQRVDAALAVFGQGLWQNPNLQANCFLLSEAAAWLKAADSTLGRLAWLSRREWAAGDSHAGDEGVPDIGRAALARCLAEVRVRLRRFDEELAHLRRGYYAPEVRAAALLFDRGERPAPAAGPTSSTSRRLAVLVVAEPSVPPVPSPYVEEGRLLEAQPAWGEGDRAALETALRLRDLAPGLVSVEVAAVGPARAAPLLRQALALGADRVRLVVPRFDTVTPDAAAAALATVLGGAGYELVLGGADATAGTEGGLVARLTAAALGLPHAGLAGQLAVRADGTNAVALLVDEDGSAARPRALPAAVTLRPGLALRPFTTAGYLAASARDVEISRWPREVAARRVRYVEAERAAAAGPADEGPGELSPREAARRILREVGAGGTPVAILPADVPVEDVPTPTLLEEAPPPAGRTLAVVGADGDGRLQPTAAGVVRAARTAAGALGTDLKLLLAAPRDEAAQRRALAQALDLFPGDILLVAGPAGEQPAPVRGRLLAEGWPQAGIAPRLVVGEPWAEDAFIPLATGPGRQGPLALRVRRLAVEGEKLVLETRRAGGRLAVRQVVRPAGGPCWVTVTDDVQATPPAGREARPRVQRWTPRLERFYGAAEAAELLQDLKREAGVIRLAEADFIVDVGFGVGNRDGFEAVVEPLVAALRRLGVRGLAVGGSRKVTEELHLLPADRQIGQSGVRVNPRVLLAIGVSGAPQHLDYIGPRATVVAFNRDPEAPLLTLNQRRPRPRVLAVLGDLFEAVPAFTAALEQEEPTQPEAAAPAGTSGAAAAAR